MNEEGLTPPETVLCGRCATACDADDNFCRHCGLTLRDDTRLPSVRSGRALPAVWQPRVPAVVVKSAAFVAAGTLAEIFLRRLVRNAFGRAEQTARSPAGRGPAVPGNGDAPMPADTQVLSETFLLRRVRFRR